MGGVDHVSLGGPEAGIGGERAGLQVADLGAENLALYPMVRKTVGTCVQAMKDFVGTGVLAQSSDNAPELVRTAAELMVPHATSTPYRRPANGRVANIIGQVLLGSRPVSYTPLTLPPNSEV